MNVKKKKQQHKKPISTELQQTLIEKKSKTFLHQQNSGFDRPIHIGGFSRPVGFLKYKLHFLLNKIC